MLWHLFVTKRVCVNVTFFSLHVKYDSLMQNLTGFQLLPISKADSLILKGLASLSKYPSDGLSIPSCIEVVELVVY